MSYDWITGWFFKTPREDVVEEKPEDKHHGFACLTVFAVTANPSLMLASNVSLHKHLKVSKPQFLHLFNGDNNMSLIGLVVGC